MNNTLVKNNIYIQSFIDKNRERIDESLVSLRLMKEIDLYLDCRNLSNKDLANDLGYSESFISQLMSGVKKVNPSFINKFEKKYNVKFNFVLQEDIDYFSELSMSYLKCNLFDSKDAKYQTIFTSNYEDVEYEIIESSCFITK